MMLPSSMASSCSSSDSPPTPTPCIVQQHWQPPPPPVVISRALLHPPYGGGSYHHQHHCYYDYYNNTTNQNPVLPPPIFGSSNNRENQQNDHLWTNPFHPPPPPSHQIQQQPPPHHHLLPMVISAEQNDRCWVTTEATPSPPIPLQKQQQQHQRGGINVIRKTTMKLNKKGVSMEGKTTTRSAVVRKRPRKYSQQKEQEPFSPTPTQNPSHLKAHKKETELKNGGQKLDEQEVSPSSEATRASKRRRPYRTPSPGILRERREAANARERRRMDRLNQWFETLRSVLPAEAATAMAKWVSDDEGGDSAEASTNGKRVLGEGEDLFGGAGGRRLSKFETLYTAQLYIARLNQLLLLGGGYGGAKSEPEQQPKHEWIDSF